MFSDENHEAITKVFEDLPAAEAALLDKLCDNFEQQLRAKKWPPIEHFLSGCREPLQPRLFRMLLKLEVEFRRKVEEPAELPGCLQRFPAHAQIVHELLNRDGAARASRPGPKIPNYLLLGELGAGAMGSVYRALHERLNNDAAVKVLKTEKLNDPRLRSFMEQEMRNLGQMRHPHIVQALNAGVTDEGVPYLVMELIDGMDVCRVLQHCGPLAVADACEVARQAALGLQHASECEMIHRDIKPSNLMLGWTCRNKQNAAVKIADFGLARICTPWNCRSSHEGVVGTLDYMAPEQYFAPDKTDIRADLFSLGCTVYALLTGKPPFTGVWSDSLEQMTDRCDYPAPPFRDLRPDVPDVLQAAILRALSSEPSRRFNTPLEFAESLSHFSGGSDLARLLESAQKRDAIVRV